MQGRPLKVVDLLRQARAVRGEPGGIQQMGQAIDLDAFAMTIRRKDSGYVAATGFTEVELPDPEQLKQAAIDLLLQDRGAPGQNAASILGVCDLSYAVAQGKEVIEPLIEVVIAAPPQAYELLRDQGSPIAQSILSALLEVCPDLGSNRLVRKTGPADPGR